MAHIWYKLQINCLKFFRFAAAGWGLAWSPPAELIVLGKFVFKFNITNIDQMRCQLISAERFLEFLFSLYILVCIFIYLFRHICTWSKGELLCHCFLTFEKEKSPKSGSALWWNKLLEQQEWEKKKRKEESWWNNSSWKENKADERFSLFPGSCRHSAPVSPYWEAHEGPTTERRSGNTT